MNDGGVAFDAASEAYLRAGLRLGAEIDDFVDFYFGPPELRAEAHELTTQAALDQLDHEVAKLPDDHRRAYLTAQARALRTVAEVQAGVQLPYRDEVEATFGIRPELVEESVFEAALDELERLLPGSGELYERRQAYRAQFTLAQEHVEPLAAALAKELRARTAAVLALPKGESTSIELVRDKPWSGYNWFLGNLRSRIEINADLPIFAYNLPDLIAHEMYCGHHTEHSFKEQHFVRERGWGEAAIALLTSPQAILSEGIATVAFETLVPPEEQADWLQRHCYAPAGLNIDVELDLAIQHAAKPLRYVSGNAALLLYEEGQPHDEIVEYITRYGLRSPGEALQNVRFITTPILRGYIFTYTAGYDLVQAVLSRAVDRSSALGQIISEHWTPERLRSSA